MSSGENERTGAKRGKDGKYLVQTMPRVDELVRRQAMKPNLQAAAAQLDDF